MAVLQSAEIARNLIIASLKANFPSFMADLRVDRGDSQTQTQLPRNYLIALDSKAYTPPTVYVITGASNTRKEQGANYANESIDATISIVVEAKTSSLVTIKSERYAAVMKKILDNCPLVSSGGELKITPLITTVDYSPIFQSTRNTGNFRREAALIGTIEAYEQAFG